MAFPIHEDIPFAIGDVFGLLRERVVRDKDHRVRISSNLIHRQLPAGSHGTIPIAFVLSLMRYFVVGITNGAIKM